MEILVASNNAHKLTELNPLFVPHQLHVPAEYGIDFQFEETGLSFLENSLGKAVALFSRTGKVSLADDSGICVDALGGKPGIHSARFGSPDGKLQLPTEERNAFLLERMKGEKVRSCRFVCCLTLYLGPDRFLTAQESCEGLLLEVAQGEGGFGYDPLVYLPELGKTVAQLGMAEKNRLSHRGRAAARILAALEKLGG